MGAAVASASPRPDVAPPGLDWVVELAPGVDPEAFAAELGAVHLGQVGILEGFHRFILPLDQAAAPSDVRADLRRRLEARSDVLWEEEQVPEPREVKFGRSEPLFARSWHLENTGSTGGLPGVDARVAAAWDDGLTGRGRHVVIVDQGTDIFHPDLSPNYVAGVDLVSGNATPMPTRENEGHGTAVAGVVAAAVNGLGGSGVAPEAKLLAARLLRDGEGIAAADEAVALGFRLDLADISNNSWGPVDANGVSLASVKTLSRRTIEDAIRLGRGGKGLIYVWSAGNGAENGDRAVYDGYNALRYTISVGSIGQDGQAVPSSEPGSNVFVAAPSFGAGAGIVTTDVRGAMGYTEGNYSTGFSGTSAAAPVVSGVVALMLEANPNLTWRDVQHVLARSAVRTDHDDAGWLENGSGFYVHDNYGFGRIDALGATRLARQWTSVEPEAFAIAAAPRRTQAIPDRGLLAVELDLIDRVEVETVEVTIALSHTAWRQLEITLISPGGTRSYLMRPFPEQGRGYQTWTFPSVQFWGERSGGRWRLEIRDTVSGVTGSLLEWSIQAFGRDRATLVLPTPVQREFPLQGESLDLTAHKLFGAAAGDWQILSAQALDGGTVTETAPGVWRFAPPKGDYGEFPVGVTVASASMNEARHHVVTVRRPLLLLGADSRVAEPLTMPSARLERSPRFGDVSDLGVDTWSFAAAEDPLSWLRVERLGFAGDSWEGLWWIPAVRAESYGFAINGRDDGLEFSLGGQGLTGPFTLQAEVRPDAWGEAATGFGRIFDRESFVVFVNGSEHAFYPDASFVVYAVYANGEAEAYTTAANTVSLGEWQDLTVSFDGNASPPVRLWRDGVSLPVTSPPEVTATARGALEDNASASLWIGDNAGGARGLRGVIGRYRLWNGVATPAQLANRDAAEARFALDWITPWREDGGAAPLVRSASGSAVAVVEAVGRFAPRDLPWAALEAYFPSAVDSASGWWLHPALGWLYGDEFPWVLAEGLGWFYASGEGQGAYWFYRPEAAVNWVYTTDALYPWVHGDAFDGWAFHLNGTAWFYLPSAGDYVAFADSE